MSFLGKDRFSFLNREAVLGNPLDWTAPDFPKLWQYHLHYFNFLLQSNLSFTQGEHLILSWITNHPPTRHAVGWEPNPISLRVVNWLKFYSLHQQTPSNEVVASLTLQAANLAREIEYHILGNHLFENAKALLFLGHFLNQAHLADVGSSILAGQLDEQFLSDGGHFELSPMYHSILLEGLLDLCNLSTATGEPLPSQLERTTRLALSWLHSILDSQQRIPLLNDSAYASAPVPQVLFDYSATVGLSTNSRVPDTRSFGAWTAQNLSGYTVARHSRFTLWFDTAPLGPDYLPGHAHGDMLSVLMDFDGRRIFEDTGVFEYEESPRRAWSRSGRAHNTVLIDNLDQAQFWKSFRVGKRGYPQNLQVLANSIGCSHNGFVRQGTPVVHHRTVIFHADGFEIIDRLSGRGQHTFRAAFHCSPGTVIRQLNSKCFLVNDELCLSVHHATPSIETTEFFPEFGKAESRPCLVLDGSFQQEVEFGIRCTFSS